MRAVWTIISPLLIAVLGTALVAVSYDRHERCKLIDELQEKLALEKSIRSIETVVNKPTQTNSPELTVNYKTPDGDPIEFVYNLDFGRVELRTPITNKRDKGLALNTLKEEVHRLTTADEPIDLGTSGLRFKFTGKYPIWGPGQHGLDKCYLYFAEKAILDGKTVVALGRDSHEEYYPYSWLLK